MPDTPTSKPSAVYFTELRLRNVRCFGDEEQVLDMRRPDEEPARWVVLLGDNGTGKTTVLECLAASMLFVNEEPGAASNGRDQILDGGTSQQLLTATRWPHVLEALAGLRIFSRIGASAGGRFSTTLRQARSQGESNLLRISARDRNVITEGYLEEGVFAASYSASRAPRGFGMLSAAEPEGADRAVGKGDPAAWLRDLDYSAARAKHGKARIRGRLELVRKTVVALLPDISELRFTDPTPDGKPPQVEFQTPDGWVPLERTAYGYQTLFVWVLDLVARLFEHYPDSDDPLSEPAVVLVDEIELHLHPSWQRDVLRFLDERFPRTQFIVTTHSPLVAQAAPEVGANIAVLRRQEGKGPVTIDNSAEAVRGWRIDQILASDLFDTEPWDKETREIMSERHTLLSKSKLTAKDRRRLDELDNKLDTTPLGESRQEIRNQALYEETLELLRKQVTGDAA